MDVLIGVVIAQGVGVVASLLSLAFKAGRVLERLENHEVRLCKLEGGSYTPKRKRGERHG